MKSRFQILDAEVELEGPDSVVEPISRAYRRFLQEGEAGPSALRIACRPEGTRVAQRLLPAPPGSDPILETYRHFLDAVLGRVGSHAILHAGAVVGGSGGALIIAGPSGHGKSSLTQALVAAGYRFLSDDFAPLQLDERTVAPYPRTVGLLPEGGAQIPAPFAAAAAASRTRLLGKVLVDVGDAVGEDAMVTSPAPLRRVVLLTHDDAEIPGPATRVELTCLESAADSITSALGSIRGIEVEAEVRATPLLAFSLRLDPTEHPTGQLSSLAARDDVLFCQKFWDAVPDFDGRPDLAPVRRRRAAEFLGRELLNRSPGSRLLERYLGDVTALFLDLAGALRDADCYRLQVGRFAPTLELLKSLDPPAPG